MNRNVAFCIFLFQIHYIFLNYLNSWKTFFKREKNQTWNLNFQRTEEQQDHRTAKFDWVQRSETSVSNLSEQRPPAPSNQHFKAPFAFIQLTLENGHLSTVATSLVSQVLLLLYTSLAVLDLRWLSTTATKLNSSNIWCFGQCFRASLL